MTRGRPLFENTVQNAEHVQTMVPSMLKIYFLLRVFLSRIQWFTLFYKISPVFEDVVSAPGCSRIGVSRSDPRNVGRNKPGKRLQLCFLRKTYF